ncbi:hypothetical protein [Cryobacterium aureum]|uniref:hypothetical protein n=1 Tax=Cryobacterium aureum TaxID=995037 RepID=UPI000CF5793F|nr:hypothetical protein [Cryobacterium aureum]
MTVDPNNDARFQRGYEPDDASSAMTELFAPKSPDRPEVSVGTDQRDSVPVPDDGALLDQFEPRNPFIVALWVIGPALIIAGPVLQARSIYESYRGNSGSFSSDDIPFEVVLQQLTYSVLPSMVGVGLATVIGLLFVEAIRWRSRTSRRSDT